jgi:hypothetical protein
MHNRRHLALAIGCLALLALAGAIFFAVDAHCNPVLKEPTLSIAPVARYLGTIRIKEEATADFILTNHSSGVCRLLGANDGCRAEGCITTETALPVDIAPGDSLTMRVHVRASHIGPFLMTLPLYTDLPGQSEAFLTLRADVLE